MTFSLHHRRSGHVKSDYNRTIIQHTFISNILGNNVSISVIVPMLQFTPTASRNGIPALSLGYANHQTRKGSPKKHTNQAEIVTFAPSIQPNLDLPRTCHSLSSTHQHPSSHTELIHSLHLSKPAQILSGTFYSPAAILLQLQS